MENSGAYSGFAQVYDRYMDNIPYEEWSCYVIDLLKEYGIAEGLVAELGCGTGEMTIRLATAGYDMIGIDCSEEMLAEALRKREEDGQSILYLQQDMRELELYGTVQAFVSVCDSMNYLENEEQLICVMKHVNNYLEASGVFLFDLKTEHYYRDVLGNRTIVDNREEGTLIWENEYRDTKLQHLYDLTIYNRIEWEDETEDSEELYERICEHQEQYVFSLETVKRCIQKAGMEFVAAYDAFTKLPPTDESERIYIVARERWQENKYYLAED